MRNHLVYIRLDEGFLQEKTLMRADAVSNFSLHRYCRRLLHPGTYYVLFTRLPELREVQFDISFPEHRTTIERKEFRTAFGRFLRTISLPALSGLVLKLSFSFFSSVFLHFLEGLYRLQQVVRNRTPRHRGWYSSR